MTEPLTRLLRDVGDDLTTPPPPASAVLRQGHRLRRRRTALVSAGASVAVVAVLAGVLLLPGAGRDDAVQPVGPPTPPVGPSLEGVTYAVGDTVHLDGGADSVRLPDREVTALAYTSAGVLAVNRPAGAAEGVAQDFTLVRPDGTTDEVPGEVGQESFGVESDQPYLAESEPASGGVDVVVRDLAADEEVARVFVPGTFDDFPASVALDGDTVYVLGRSGSYPFRLTLVDWRTGAVDPRGPFFAGLDIAGGRTTALGEDDYVNDVVDVRTQELLHSATRAMRGGERFDVGVGLSPTGRYAEDVLFSRTDRSSTTQLVDLDTDEPLDLRVPPSAEVAWSAFDQPFWVDADGVVTVCDPLTGDCVDEQRPELAGDPDDVLLGGLPYGP